MRRIHIHCAACENKVFGKNTLHEKYPCLLLLNIFEIHLREKFLQAATTQFQEIHNLMYLGHKYIHICVYIVVDICLVNMMLSNNKCNRIATVLYTGKIHKFKPYAKRGYIYKSNQNQ